MPVSSQGNYTLMKFLTARELKPLKRDTKGPNKERLLSSSPPFFRGKFAVKLRGMYISRKNYLEVQLKTKHFVAGRHGMIHGF